MIELQPPITLTRASGLPEPWASAQATRRDAIIALVRKHAPLLGDKRARLKDVDAELEREKAIRLAFTGELLNLTAGPAKSLAAASARAWTETKIGKRLGPGDLALNPDTHGQAVLLACLPAILQSLHDLKPDQLSAELANAYEGADPLLVLALESAPNVVTRSLEGRALPNVKLEDLRNGFRRRRDSALFDAAESTDDAARRLAEDAETALSWFESSTSTRQDDARRLLSVALEPVDSICAKKERTS
jgi:hypothetical protein